MAAGRTRPPLSAMPAAAIAEAGAGFAVDRYGGRFATRLPLAAPAFATGTTPAVDGLIQQVFAARQAAMLGAAGTTGPPLAIHSLMPLLTL